MKELKDNEIFVIMAQHYLRTGGFMTLESAEFAAHLRYSTMIVNSWPTWKQNVLRKNVS